MITRRSIFAIFATVMLFSCSKSQPGEQIKIKWEKIKGDGLEGDLAKGVSAAYGALINNHLIVAGGANFPGKLSFEGGTKVFYDEILLYDRSDNMWKIIGHLPQPSAYGVSVSLPNGVLWIGGKTATGSLSSCYMVSFSENKGNNSSIAVELSSFASLPASMDNFAGCAIGETVFVAGGNVNGEPSNTFYTINVESDTTWEALPPFPGLPRLQPVMAAIENEGKTYVYLLGGFFGGDTERVPAMTTDMLRYDLMTGRWEKVAEQIDPESGEFFSLGGATAMPVENRYILCLGGVNHAVFLEAITKLHKIAYDPQLTEEQKKQQNDAFSAIYLTQPINYYQFNSECRLFDTVTREWTTIDKTQNTARAGATLVWKGNTFYAVQGELKPGVRSPETWKGTILIR